VGANATVLSGLTIGCWAMVGAGSVVTGDVPAHALVVGNPARQTGWACRCGQTLPEDLACSACGRGWLLAGDGTLEERRSDAAHDG
jgi:UDP-2-acetamido-3-amino-2,3-dideoxy-glucuronate N-acetyltransferase